MLIVIASTKSKGRGWLTKHPEYPAKTTPVITEYEKLQGYRGRTFVVVDEPEWPDYVLPGFAAFNTEIPA